MKKEFVRDEKLLMGFFMGMVRNIVYWYLAQTEIYTSETGFNLFYLSI